MLKKKDAPNAEKHQLVEEAIASIGTKFGDMIMKHDGCRLL